MLLTINVSENDLRSLLSKCGFNPEETTATAEIAPVLPTTMSVEDAAKYLGVSKPTISRWQANGTLPFVKMGSRVTFLREDLDHYLREHKVRKYGLKN